MRFAFTLVLCLPLCAAVPEAPSGLTASDAAYPGRIRLAWNHVRDAQTYRVFRRTTNNATTGASLGVTESIQFTDVTGPGESYFYWVRAEGPSGQSALSASDRGSTSIGNAAFTPPPQIGVAPAGVPIPSGNPLTAARIYLGKTLFWDEQLSSTRTVACGTCHVLGSGGTDPRSVKDSPSAKHPGADGVFGTADDVVGSPGIPATRADGSYQWSPVFGLQTQVTPRRASSVLDAAFATQGVLWDSRSGTQLLDPVTGQIVLSTGAALEAQSLLPLLNTAEMAHEGRTLADVVDRISQSQPLALSPSVPPALAKWIGGRSYAALFEDAFGTPEITATRLAMAVASYERTLLAEQTAFDNALTPQLTRAVQTFTREGCALCHRVGVTSDGLTHPTGVRPVAEDAGRGAITNVPQDMGAFRTPSLRNAGRRGGLFHTGANNIEDVIAFYDRGGDFRDSPGFQLAQVRRLNLSTEEKSDLALFLRYQLLDTRASSESGPLFDRPMLYSESARVPVLTGVGSGAVIPQAIAIEPAYAGSPRCTVAVTNVPAFTQAVLVIDRTDPGTGAIPTTGSFLRRAVTTDGNGSQQGYASLSFPIPSDTRPGTTLFGRWYVAGGVSRAFRFTVFVGAPEAEEFSTVSAASLTKGVVARGSIVSGFGVGLADSTVVASGKPPATLGGLRITVTDRTSASFDAPLFFVSAGQINYIVPSTMADGEARVAVLRGDTVIARGKLQVTSAAPALFTANADGWDAPAALVQRVPASGPSSTTGIIRLDADVNRYVPAPISLGPATDQVFLLLFGTGIGGIDVTATIGGIPADVLYSGPQGEFDGLDQVNLRIPRALAGRGSADVVLWAGGLRANTVRVAIQ